MLAWIGEDEDVVVAERPHGVALARPLVRALALAAVGAGLVLAGVRLAWPVAVPGAALLALAALGALRSVWRWDRTAVVVTSDRLVVTHGIVRRRAAAVPLARLGAVEVEQSLPGRVLGYGTLVAGELEIPYVPHPRELARHLR